MAGIGEFISGIVRDLERPTVVAGSPYLQRDTRSLSEAAAELREKADQCRRIAAVAGAHCNTGVRLKFEAHAAEFDAKADHAVLIAEKRV